MSLWAVCFDASILVCASIAIRGGPEWMQAGQLALAFFVLARFELFDSELKNPR